MRQIPHSQSEEIRAMLLISFFFFPLFSFWTGLEMFLFNISPNGIFIIIPGSAPIIEGGGKAKCKPLWEMM